MAAQTPPDHVEPQEFQCVRVEISIENPDFDLNFEYADFEKNARQKCVRFYFVHLLTFHVISNPNHVRLFISYIIFKNKA